MYHFKFSILLLLSLLFSLNSIASNVVNTKWSLKEELVEPEVKKDIQKHSIKVGYSSKTINALSVKSSTQDFQFNSQQMPGINFNYDYKFSTEGVTSSLYTNLGYYTKYNDLGAQGYADLSLFDLYAGLTIGYTFFSKFKLTPKLLAGIGNSYYYQRGDVSEVSAEANYIEREIGSGLDFEIPKKDAFPDSWSNNYILSLRYTQFESLSGDTKIDGTKFTATFGVQI